MAVPTIDQILRGETRAVARAATAIENRTAEARALVEALRAKAGRAIVAGITGPPGAGKSTLADQVTAAFRAQGKTVGIVAVDPTSPVSGGAILGDRIRMQRHYGDDGVFIRSMASRGALGGLAPATRDMVTLLDASGRDVVLVETVGVGQAEVEIAGVAGFTVVVLVPGMGDDVQALKAGLLEVAQLFVVNKADHEGADKLVRELGAFASVPILKTVASDGTGIAELVSALTESARPARAMAEVLRAAAKIDHLGIAVRSIDAALGFYRDQLGLTVSLREAVEREGVDVAMLQTGESRLELLQAASADSTVGKFIEKRGEGLHHVALRVADFEGVLARLRTAGARLLNEPRQGAGGHVYVFVHPASTGGVLIEIIKEH